VTRVEATFERVAARKLAEDRGLRGRVFGSTGRKTAGNVCAMTLKGQFVVKLPPGESTSCSRLARSGPSRPGTGV
jgi:hypothetical protein